MKDREVSLQEILDARESRVLRQKQLLGRFEKPLICFTMNIAGPVKTSPLIKKGFDLGNRWLKAQLASASVPVVFCEEFTPHTGCEGYYVVDATAETVKSITVQLEDLLPVGRLFDLDVIAPDGSKLQRQALGLPQRKCLICGENAALCSRSRAHPVHILQAETTRLLLDALHRETAREVAALAQRSLLYEVCAAPKPGLVDRYNSGSHQDMDIFTFMSSAAALYPYFETCVLTGIRTADFPPEETFRQLRFHGRLAEQTMFRATGGVNTHKGAIFTMGLLCGAIGRLSGLQQLHPQTIAAECASMTRGLTQQDAASPDSGSVGRQLLAQYHITGIRGEAEAGFPSVLHAGLPVLEQGVSAGMDLNDAGCAALLAIMSAADDTNLIARGSIETQRKIRHQIAGLLKTQPFPTREVLKELDQAFTQNNLSPGGSADLLAASYFLYFLTHPDQ